MFAGAHDIKNVNDGYKDLRVVRIIKHKNFEPSTLKNDIAILTLEYPVQIGYKISPICLPTFDDDFTGQTVTVAGWGALQEGGSQPAKLREVDVKVMTNYECGRLYDHRISGKIENNMLCAKGDNKDSCSVSTTN